MPPYLKQMEIGPMQNFVYFIGDSDLKKCWVIDPAWDMDTILRLAQEDGYSVEGALITHAHYDHCNGVEPLLEKLNVPIYINKKDVEMGEKVAETGLFGQLPKEHLKFVESGDKISLGGTELTFLHTPGHTPGSQCFLVNNSILAGDTLFIHSCGRTDLPGGNPYQLFETLNQRIAPLPGETILYPGHNYEAEKSISLAEAKNRNRLFQAHTLDDFLGLVGF